MNTATATFERPIPEKPDGTCSLIVDIELEIVPGEPRKYGLSVEDSQFGSDDEIYITRASINGEEIELTDDEACQILDNPFTRN